MLLRQKRLPGRDRSRREHLGGRFNAENIHDVRLAGQHVADEQRLVFAANDGRRALRRGRRNKPGLVPAENEFSEEHECL